VFLHVTRVISAGWCVTGVTAVVHHPATTPQGLRIQRQKVQIVIFCAFNDKKLVHFVGTIIVQLSTCTERQQLKKKSELHSQ
jgi:hypothetical protein